MDQSAKYTSNKPLRKFIIIILIMFFSLTVLIYFITLTSTRKNISTTKHDLDTQNEYRLEPAENIFANSRKKSGNNTNNKPWWGEEEYISFYYMHKVKIDNLSIMCKNPKNVAITYDDGINR